LLRQVFIFYKNEIIFQYFFAKAYDKEALEIVLKKRLITYITNPIENKILSRPLLDFQSHFVFINGVFFLFVTDMADRPKIIAKEMERASKLFLKNFPDPLKIKESSPEKEEFTIFIKETHYYLHPKISLIGSLGAGKSTIVEILNQEKSHGKKIMDFAFYYRIQMGEIYFDLWDFITRDDFSPLWNNFVRGSDVIFFVIDGSNLNDEKIKFFTNLKRREGKYSNWAIILTHSDSPNFLHAPNLKEKYNYLKDVNIYEINLTDSNVLRDLSLIFIKTIGLKESLPSEFRTLLVQANNLVAEEKLSESINIIRKLVGICEEYQEFAYLEVFKNKIRELEEKLKLKLEKEKLEQEMFRAPEKIKFQKFEGVSSVPIPGKNKKIPAIKKITTPKIQPRVSNLKDSADNKGKGFDSSIVSDIKEKNPFFGGMKPVSPKAQRLKIEIRKPKSAPIKELPPGAPIQDFEIKTHKISPINIDRLSKHQRTSNIEMKEKYLQTSISKFKSGQTRDKKLTLERSPLVSQTTRSQAKNEIRKSKPVSSKINENPLASFILKPKKDELQISNEAEKLGQEIRNLGESLSRALCQKFVEQLKIRLNRTNLTDSDINKAALLYVTQRRKRDNSS